MFLVLRLIIGMSRSAGNRALLYLSHIFTYFPLSDEEIFSITERRVAYYEPLPIAARREYSTSEAVRGLPSENVTPSFMLKVYTLSEYE